MRLFRKKSESFKLLNGCLYHDPLEDIDGNLYKTVKIGSRIWLAENLRVTRYRNGDPVPPAEAADDWIKLETGARCVYNNDINNADIYGFLYNWYAIDDNRNIAPPGWHVPSFKDWQYLNAFLGGESLSGGKMKTQGTGFWEAPNTNASNASGFSALPAGFRRGINGIYFYSGYFIYFWSAEERDKGYKGCDPRKN